MSNQTSQPSQYKSKKVTTQAHFFELLKSGDDFEQYDVANLDLSGVDFKSQPIIGCDLTGINLKGANLSGCDMTEACLDEADLTGANLTKAVLDEGSANGATFDNANLTEFSGVGAYFRCASFKNAVAVLRRASVYAQRADWLLCGDDDEESFHDHLAEYLSGIEDRSTEEML